MSLFDKLQATIATTLKVPSASVTPTTRDEDLPSWDSLGQVNLIMAIEQTFDVYIEVEEFANLNSIPAILAFLERNGAS
jgi:acyl carrier protein